MYENSLQFQKIILSALFDLSFSYNYEIYNPLKPSTFFRKSTSFSIGGPKTNGIPGCPIHGSQFTQSVVRSFSSFSQNSTFFLLLCILPNRFLKVITQRRFVIKNIVVFGIKNDKSKEKKSKQ